MRNDETIENTNKWRTDENWEVHNLALDDLEITYFNPQGTVVEHDCSCKFQLYAAKDELDRGRDPSSHPMDSPRLLNQPDPLQCWGHGTTEAKKWYTRQLLENHNIIIKWQPPRSLESGIECSGPRAVDELTVSSRKETLRPQENDRCSGCISARGMERLTGHNNQQGIQKNTYCVPADCCRWWRQPQSWGPMRSHKAARERVEQSVPSKKIWEKFERGDQTNSQNSVRHWTLLLWERLTYIYYNIF